MLQATFQAASHRCEIDLDQAEPALRSAVVSCKKQRVKKQRVKKERVMGILSWIILGLIAGFLGSKIVDRQGQGFWLDIALGIVGALVGGFLFDLFGASG